MKQILLPLGFLLLLVILIGFMSMPVDKVVFMDVGQGDSILIQHKTSQVLIDGGKGAKVLPRLAEELPYFDRTIEVVIATHPDQDHIEGLLHVLDRYDVKLVILPQVPHNTNLQAQWLTKLHDFITERDVQYRFAWQGQNIQIGNVKISILAPFDNGDFSSFSKTNDASVVTRLDMHGRSFLLTGDAEKKAENMLVQAYRDNGMLDVDILQAGHHGSNTSTHASLIRETSPYAAVVSVGAENSYGHPHPVVLDRLSDIRLWRTDKDGSVKFIFREDDMSVSLGGETVLR